MKRHTRSGFTLVELLVVMMIIAMLAALTYGAMFQAMGTAREARTKALIAKLHGQMMARYESYRTRRVPLMIPPGTPPKVAAQLRLNMLRDLMRLEIPNCYVDITTAPATMMNPDSNGNPRPPALNISYRNKLQMYPNYTAPWESAECLYLILTTAAGEEGLSAYELTSSDVGDIDGDGMKEFWDGWGQPISFIRWPTGYVSDLQPLSTAGMQRNPDWLSTVVWSTTSPNLVPDYANSHDPLDVRKINTFDFALTPLIFSRGPDGVQDMYQYYGTTAAQLSDPYWSMSSSGGGPGYGLGQIGDFDQPTDGQIGAYDNITNHMIGTRQ